MNQLNKIIGLAESGERREQLSSAAFEFAEEMDWKSITKRYLGVFSTHQRAPR